MITTNVYYEEGKYGRLGILEIQGDEIVFDSADAEYGVHRLPISVFMKAFGEHIIEGIQEERKLKEANESLQSHN